MAKSARPLRRPDYAGPVTRDDLNPRWDTHIAGEYGGASGTFPGSDNNHDMFQNRDHVANAVGTDGAETCTTYGAPFATHGGFVRRVEKVADNWAAAGLFTAAERPTVIRYASQAELELRA